MNPILVILPFALVLAVLLYGILRVFGRIWLEHRVRLALLERIDKKPELVESVQGLMDLMGVAEPLSSGTRQDYAVTGILLALIGAGCCGVGWMLHSGKLAVGIYAGGWVCVFLGFILFMAGLFVRKLLRHPIFFPHRR
ncbi:MAG TPA: hypothetical protein VMZ06_07620 [Candidatus Bathyarchaeia archaeon]|nr:hypothetical protein [Candidatus Bathyarchaeia archaeon]